MRQRKLGQDDVSIVGLGCMNLSHAYGTPPDEGYSEDLLLKALDAGYTHFDTAALYGFGHNETLVGKALAARRDEFLLASKCGMDKGPDGKKEINGRPEKIRQTLETALSRLKTDVIDLYYLHRWDKSVPIEESVGALSDLVTEGKIRMIGLSEISADTLRKAQAVHPITAVQSEYSLWTRNPEIAMLAACKELGVAFVAFSPVGRGFLSGKLTDVSGLAPKDVRRTMPRFAPDIYPKNLALLEGLRREAAALGCTMSQLALAWVMAQGDHIHALPGTANMDHMQENAAAAALTVDPGVFKRLEAQINQETVIGGRYAPAVQAEVDTEEYAA
ncbi:MAG: aldo/keto reductase [Magnetospiraceae bacterium]